MPEKDSGNRKYREAVHQQWTKEYYAWLKANVRAEVWTVVAGAIAPAGAALVAYFVWPKTIPVSMTEAVGIAAFLGTAGGITALLLLMLGTSVKQRLLAPRRLWAANQEALEQWQEAHKSLNDHYVRMIKQADVAHAKEIERLKGERQELENTVNRLKAECWSAFAETKIDLFYGEASRKTRQQRADALRVLYEERRNQIQQGDFSRASEIVPIVRAYLPLLNQVIPHGSVAYENAEREMHSICSQVEKHIAGMTAKS